MTTEIVFTALPTGRDPGGRLRLTAHVTPVLTTADGNSTTLVDFPQFTSWPPADLDFRVLVDGITDPLQAFVVSDPPDPQMWQALFPAAGTTVRSREFADRSQDTIHTAPTTKIAQWLQDQYTTVAVASPENFPEITDLLANGWEDIAHAGRGREAWLAARAALVSQLARGGVVDTREPSAATFDFVQLHDFFAPEDLDDPDVLDALEEDVELPTLDFHDAVQFCNQHPTLLRLLGLAFDLEVDLAGNLPPAPETMVHVVAASGSFPEHATILRLPRTHCVITHDAFATRRGPQGGHLGVGFLRLQDPNWFEPIVIDVEGGGLKAINAAGNLARRDLRRSVGRRTDSSLPSLRADALAVALKGSAKQLRDRLVAGPAAVAALGSDTLELWAEDLVRGFRVDVWDSQSKRWHSLMHRDGHYELSSGTWKIPVTDEAFLVESASRRPRRRDLYQAETLFSWDGWSQAVPRPGRTHGINPADPDPLMDQPEDAPTDFDVRFDFGIVPGTLPRLRYGTGYRFRARTVDLAGNSLPPDTDDASHATSPVVYGRFEPPQTPPVLLKDPRGPGESVETVVLRSNYDIDPPVPEAMRHLVPPKVGQTTLEHHGVLDVVDGGALVLDKLAYADLDSHDAATLRNHPDAQEDPHDHGDPDGTVHYPVDTLDVHHSGDPTAFTFAFKLLDGPHAGALVYGSFEPASGAGGSWRNLHAVRLSVHESALANGELPHFDHDRHVLGVPLRKGDLVHARLSAVLRDDDLERFGLWHWILQSSPSNATLGELTGLIGTGQHWMFEPFRILTLVHAVRQPLLPPTFPVLSADRQLGEHPADVSGTLHFSRRSTSRVDVLADWFEPVDDGPGTDPPIAAGEPASVHIERAPAFVLDTIHDDALPEESDTVRARHELPDTRHRMITYRGVATTRYGEFFTDIDRLTWDPSMVDQVIVLHQDGLVPDSVKVTHRPAAPDPDAPATQALVEDEHFEVDPEGGSITFLATVTDLAQPPVAGDTVEVVFLAPPVTRETPDPPEPGETGPVLVNVPSSARPDAPDVRYVIPTFAWTSSETPTPDGPIRSSTRTGRALRVYLGRPWWTSGEGEALAVVTWPEAEGAQSGDLEADPDDPTSDEDPRRPYVTQWGLDPVYLSLSLPDRYPRLDAFPDATQTNLGPPPRHVTLAELEPTPGQQHPHPVNVAAHEVAFDEDRDLWYCDVQVDSGSAYLPFIRLALARYQPSSTLHAHLSRVVLADFVQLAPDRSASVVPLPNGDLRVTLVGPTHHMTEASGSTVNPGTARVILERRDAGSGELGWKPIGKPTEMSAGFTPSVTGQWTATVKRPGPQANEERRLVIEQFELLGEEPMERHDANLAAPTKPIPAPRLVHTDIIVL